jgi:hypothetical protein
MESLQPDHLLKGLFRDRIKVDVFAMEAKLPNKKGSQILDDTCKLGNELKLMLDRLVKLGVPEPVIGGLVVIGKLETIFVSLYMKPRY